MPPLGASGPISRHVERLDVGTWSCPWLGRKHTQRNRISEPVDGPPWHALGACLACWHIRGVQAYVSQGMRMLLAPRAGARPEMVARPGRLCGFAPSRRHGFGWVGGPAPPLVRGSRASCCLALPVPAVHWLIVSAGAQAPAVHTRTGPPNPNARCSPDKEAKHGERWKDTTGAPTDGNTC